MESNVWSEMMETRLRVMLDTNVVLDWLLDRKPHSDEAVPLWQACDSHQIILYLPASVLPDIFYILRRQYDADLARRALSHLLWMFRIVSVDKLILLHANQLRGDDFEDNVAIACAEIAQIDFIVTRNLKDFQYSSVKAVDPKTFVTILRQPQL